LDPSIDRTALRVGTWAEDEDQKLVDAVQTHGGKDWVAIAALIPGRTKIQCWKRWKDVLDPSIDRVNKRTGKWSKDEDIKLKDGVQIHGGKNWVAIAALVLGRTGEQCRARWKEVLDPSIDRANGRTGKWSAEEDSKLKDAERTHGGKNWAAISALVPGRTKIQCWNRWHDFLDPSIDKANERTGK
jgi:myb proto-oncogene protein